MTINSICPSCKASLEIHDYSNGDIIDCPNCGHSYVLASVAQNKSAISSKKESNAKSNNVDITPLTRQNATTIDLLQKIIWYIKLWTWLFVYIPVTISILYFGFALFTFVYEKYL